jgi:hypothetical protein
MLASHSLTIILIIVLFLCTNIYIHNTSISKQTYFSFRPVIQYLENTDTLISSPPVLEHNIPEACKNVDFRWM